LFLSYTPGVGTTVKINDKTKGTISGRDFMSALWAIWLGSNPADGDLKEGMLGK
ncbi:MAG: chalcone isomerase family protein, partial [Deltaproteobacteria bacterium]|nr:chalcone isomerase family protein [Deltaproteobacteria bacterium]